MKTENPPTLLFFQFARKTPKRGFRSHVYVYEGGRGALFFERLQGQGIFIHCDIKRNSESSCWRKYQEKAPNCQRKDNQQAKAEASNNVETAKPHKIRFNLATIVNERDMFCPTSLMTKFSRQ